MCTDTWQMIMNWKLPVKVPQVKIREEEIKNFHQKTHLQDEYDQNLSLKEQPGTKCDQRQKDQDSGSNDILGLK